MRSLKDVTGPVLQPIRRALDGASTGSACESIWGDVHRRPEGSQAFTNDARFVEWLRQVADFNRQHGMRALEAVSIRDVPLSPLHTLAAVIWGARFEKTGSRVIQFEISYLLENTGDDWRILSYISRSDQNAEMAKEGLL